MASPFGDPNFGFVHWDDLNVFLSGYDKNQDAYEYSVFDNDKCILNLVVSDGDVWEGKVDDYCLLDEMVPVTEAHMTHLLSKEDVDVHYALCCKCYHDLYLDALEQEGFSKIVWFSGGDFSEINGKPFDIIERVIDEPEPGWIASFEGDERFVYPEEVIPSLMKAEGCPYTDEQYGIQPNRKASKGR